MRVRPVRFLLLAAALLVVRLPLAAQAPARSPQSLTLADAITVDPQTRRSPPNGRRS